jgi:AraC family transcriptional regulator
MKLKPGKYFGETVRQQARQGLILTLSRYAPGQAQPWHVHANPTLYVLIAGDHRDQVRRAELDQLPLTTVFHPTTEPHAALVGPRGMLGFNVEYEGAWLERHELREQDLGVYRPLESVWARLGALHLFAHAFHPGGQLEADVDGEALELLSPLVKQAFGRQKMLRPAWLRRAEAFIHDAFRTSVRLREVAHEAGVHPVHLARVFRQHHGCSVSEYIRALRVAEAGRLILGQDQSIAGAASETGFADQAHLCRWFSRQFGFSPRTLRSAAEALRGDDLKPALIGPSFARG